MSDESRDARDDDRSRDARDDDRSRDARDDELERAVAAAPGGEGFPRLAEHYRRAGRLSAAERVAERGLARTPESPRGRAVLLLTLLDAGRVDEVRRRLEGWLGAAEDPPALALPEPHDLGEGVSQGELDRAFEAAEPELDAMITPDSIAEEATLRAEGPFAAHPFESSPLFNTRTMAELLERQGDASGAARIRAALGTHAPAPAEPASPQPEPGRRGGTIEALERWLENARRVRT